jgi:hypothetical protein
LNSEVCTLETSRKKGIQSLSSGWGMSQTFQCSRERMTPIGCEFVGSQDLSRLFTELFTSDRAYKGLTKGTDPFLGSRQLCSYSKTSQHFMEPEGSLSCSQEPSTGPYPEPDRSSPYHPILSLLRSILILSIHLRLGLTSDLFPSGFPTNILYAFLFGPIRATHPAHLRTSCLKLFNLFLNIINLVGFYYGKT